MEENIVDEDIADDDIADEISYYDDIDISGYNDNYTANDDIEIKLLKTMWQMMKMN